VARIAGSGTTAFAAAALAATPLATTPPALAAGFDGSVALTSDYVYQGLSRTCGGPAVQADAQVGTPLAPREAFAGVWGSVGLGSGYCRRAREFNLYAGERLAIGTSQSLTLTYVHYAFPGGIYLYERLGGRRFDYDELGGTWAFQDRIYLTAAWTPNAIGYRNHEAVRERTAVSFGAQLHQPIRDWLTFSVGVGYDEVSDLTGAGYAFWDAGVARPIGPIELDVSYFRTSPRAERLFGPEIAGGRVAATAVWRF